MTQARELNGVSDGAGEVHFLPVPLVARMTRLARLEYLLDGAQEPVRIFEHDLIELAPLLVAELPRLESLEVQPNRSNGGLEFVGNGVEKAVLIFVLAD